MPGIHTVAVEIRLVGPALAVITCLNALLSYLVKLPWPVTGIIIPMGDTRCFMAVIAPALPVIMASVFIQATTMGRNQHRQHKQYNRCYYFIFHHNPFTTALRFHADILI